MISNPEIWKNMVCELRLARLIGAPVFICAAAGATYFEFRDSDPFGLIAQGAFWALILFCGLWGGKAVGASIREEGIRRTWDWHRLSGQSALEFAFGKILGAGVFAWYCAVFLLLVLGGAVVTKSGMSNAASLVLWMVLCLLSLHGLIALFSLMTLRVFNLGGTIRYGTIRTFVVGLLFIPVFMSQNILASQIPLEDGAALGVEKIVWYGVAFGRFSFIAMTLSYLLFWVTLGNVRLSARLFGERQSPVAWLCFVIFCTFFAAGFAPFEGRASNTIFLGLFYGMLAVTLLVVVAYCIGGDQRAVIRAVRSKSVKQIWTASPLWGVSLLFLTSISFLSFVARLSAQDPFALLIMSAGDNVAGLVEGYGYFVVALIALLLRDGLIVRRLVAMRAPGQGGSVVALYLFAVYVLLPLLVILSGWPLGATAFWPVSAEPAYMPFCMGLAVLQVIVLGAFLWKKRRNSFG